MCAPAELFTLIERFSRNLEQYKATQYNETQVRVDYIDPLFELLGWDMHNRSGYAEQYREVVHEDRLKIGKATKAPDYSFRIGGTRKFFLEAKKPSVDLKTDVGPTFQIRRYAWSAGLPLSILTDFEEFAVYDCRIEPHRHDRPATARVMYFTFEQYAEAWDEIAEVFAKESILQGSFDRYSESTKKKRGTAEVDDAFLAEIESWREMLAKNIALRNREITTRELNQAVQATIDRIIFLRIAEDRGAEQYGQLQSLQNGANIYRRLVDIYRHADRRYNSGLFHFDDEKGRGGVPDTWTTALEIDDRPLKEIFRRLYYPDSPYEFSVLPGSILGQVYEQFLGKVIRLTPGHQAKVEEKPEVRKAGGVYYTPEYVARYIVRDTVGELLNGKTPSEVSTIRVLDPACGSGSFLLTAYDYLLDWHLEWYGSNDPEKHARGKDPAIYRVISPDPESPPSWKLTTSEKKRILLNNIYGVDIDAQAVEVTKLSLLLRVLEDENEQTINVQTSFAERILPDLVRNITCGNSLIGPEFYETGQVSAFDEETLYRVNVFDWHKEFESVMRDGGFDAVIGNPPYIRIQHMKEWAPLEVEFYKTAYRSAGTGNYDIYVVFVEKGLQLLREGGLLGYILPHKFFNARYGAPLREIIADGDHLRKVVHFGDAQIFSGATTYTCLLFLSAEPNDEFTFEKVTDLESWRLNAELGEGAEDAAIPESGLVPLADVGRSEWNFIVGPGKDLFRKLSEMPVTLDAVCSRIFQGLKTGSDKVYIVNELNSIDDQTLIRSPQDDQQYWIESELLHPLIKGGDSKPYRLVRTDRLILFPYQKAEKLVRLIEESILKNHYPLAWKYLNSHRNILENRENGKMRGADWFAYSRNQALDLIPAPKIFTPDIAPEASYSVDEIGEVFFTGGAAGGYGILPNQNYSFEFLLGLLNSRTLDWFLKRISTAMRGGWYSYESRYISRLPIPVVSPEDGDAVSRHDQLSHLVRTILDLHRRLSTVKTAHDRTLLQRQIEATNQQINRLVYDLYELTETDVAIIEKGG